MRIVVLSDEDTYSGVDGSFILDIPDDWDSGDIDEYLRERRHKRPTPGVIETPAQVNETLPTSKVEGKMPPI